MNHCGQDETANWKLVVEDLNVRFRPKADIRRFVISWPNVGCSATLGTRSFQPVGL
jgi:hypothetical protein